MEESGKSGKKSKMPLIVSLVLLIIIFGVSALFMAKSNKPEYKICKSFIDEIVSAPDFAKFNSGKDIAEYLVKTDSQRYSLYGEDGDGIFIGDKYGFMLKFFKYGECSLDKYNCYMLYNSVIYHKKYQPVEREEQIITPVYKVFFDTKGKTKFVEMKEDIKFKI